MTERQKHRDWAAEAVSESREVFYSLWQPIEEWKGNFLFVWLRDIDDPTVQAATGVLSPSRRCDPKSHPRIVALLSGLPIWPVADRDVAIFEAHDVRWLRVGFYRVSSRLVLEQPGTRPIDDYECNLPRTSGIGQAAWIDDMLREYTDGEITSEIVRGVLALHMRLGDCPWGQEESDLYESTPREQIWRRSLLCEVEVADWERHLERIGYTVD